MTYSEIQDLIDTNLASATKIPALKHREVEHALLDYIQSNLSQSGDIKPIKCDITYLNANFEPSGLGKNLREGWAICNGNIHSGQQVENIAGKTIVGFGGSFTTFSQKIGSPDTVVVEHTHPSGSYNTGSGSSLFTGKGLQGGNDIVYHDTQSAGVSGVGKNYQPSIILLYIQKL